ncbi:hypothetical protein HMPREF9441_01586 [Paraprevotella clara YIT 11840]|uniref:Uncharacterized protein n=1 Tax=Paraprevotella clara YIT 11840 TaxID=762968 RepID=G5SQE7_9BACT|nr:hypothetical protein HMPREF9441_01586 [Paraprevotella clara YIT 11840]
MCLHQWFCIRISCKFNKYFLLVVSCRAESCPVYGFLFPL